MDHFQLKDGELYCEDVPLAAIAAEVGTPVYVYSTATMRRHVEALRSALAGVEDPLICYAVKANPNAAVLATLAADGLGADVVSGGEYRRAVAAAVVPDKIVFSGVGKTAEEMRLALHLHRVPGMDDSVPTPDDVFCMCTEHGAETTGFGTTIGALEVGRAADIVLMDWKQIASPYLDDAVPPLHGIVHRAKKVGVDAVMIAGEMILERGRFTRIDKEKVLEEIADHLSKRLTRYDLAGKTITLKIKYSDFTIQTRSKTLPYFIADKSLLLEAALELLYQEKLKESVRLLGISMSNLNTEVKKSVAVQLKFDF